MRTPPWNAIDDQQLTLARENLIVCYPLGHYYSPVPDTRELAREPRHQQVWPPEGARELVGIDWRHEQQVELVRALGRQERIEFPQEEQPASTGAAPRYHALNESFGQLDASVLEGMLRHLAPARVIEVGSGLSTLVIAEVAREHAREPMHVTTIDPYAETRISTLPGVDRVRREMVQDTPHEVFAELGAGDVLFIDSSHVVKTGSDVTWLFLEVLPRLAAGVVVHIHDIFLPAEYPRSWVLGGRAWNEQYLLQSFLAFNSEFEIMLGVQYMLQCGDGVMDEAFAVHPMRGGGSFWMRRRDAAGAEHAAAPREGRGRLG